MPRYQCSNCADSGNCPACHGSGERVRVRRFLFFHRREVVTCKLCRGRGSCPFCWSPSEAGSPAPQSASRRRGLRSVGGGSD